MSYSNDQSYINLIRGIPNHPPCDVCGKYDGGTMSGTGIGNHKVCGQKCFKRMEMRINNGLVTEYEEETITKDLLRIRIRQLKHQLKLARIKPNRT